MRLGPITGATLIVRDLKRSIAAYVELLELVLIESGPLPQQRALDMGDASLALAPCARLSGHAAAAPWLTLIEMPLAPLTVPYARRGWLALVFAVSDVAALSVGIDRQVWQVLGEPAERAGVTSTRSMQLAGPDGEVLHLQNQSAAGVLPLSASGIHLYGVVLGAADSRVALGFYEGLGLLDRWCRQTTVAAISQASATVAFGQLSGAQTIEIDPLATLPANDADLRTGLRLVSFARSDRDGRRLVARDDPSARILAGPEGEGIELV